MIRGIWRLENALRWQPTETNVRINNVAEVSYICSIGDVSAVIDVESPHQRTAAMVVNRS